MFKILLTESGILQTKHVCKQAKVRIVSFPEWRCGLIFSLICHAMPKHVERMDTFHNWTCSAKVKSFSFLFCRIQSVSVWKIFQKQELLFDNNIVVLFMNSSRIQQHRRIKNRNIDQQDASFSEFFGLVFSSYLI